MRKGILFFTEVVRSYERPHGCQALRLQVFRNWFCFCLIFLYFQVLFKLLPELEQLSEPRTKIASWSIHKATIQVLNKEYISVTFAGLPLNNFCPFSGSLTHLGASRGLQSQKRGPFWIVFWPSLTPPANPVKFFWSKMACTGVPHIVLHVSCRTRTSGGYFWPSEVRFRGILALSSDWFYNGHIENLG